MGSDVQKKLRELSKDEESFKQLRELVSSLKEERDTYRKNLNLLESAIRADYDSILITELNLEKPGPRIVYVNDGFTRMTGYSREEVIGSTPRILQGPKTDRAVLDKLKDRLREGQSFFGQAINYKKDGTEFVNQWDIHPLTDREGNITHWVSYQHDITERKRAERVLVDNNISIDELREESHRTVVDVDEQGNIVMANKSFRELIGYGKNDLKRIKVWDLLPRKYRESLKKRFEDSIHDQFSQNSFRGIIRHKAGVPIQVEGRTRILDLKDQPLIRAEVRNISLQKKVMDTLRKRNKDFGRIFSKASEYEYYLKFIEDQPVLKYVSEQFPPLTGLSPKSVIDQNSFDEFVHLDDLPEFKQYVDKLRKGQSCTCQYRIRISDGSYISVLDVAKPEWDDKHDKVKGAHGSVSLKGDTEPFEV